jgi:hypothetical protein
MQNFGELRFEPRAFARGHDGDRDTGRICCVVVIPGGNSARPS